MLYLRCIWLVAWPFAGDPKTSGKVGWAWGVVVVRSVARWLRPSQAVETTTLLKPTGKNKQKGRIHKLIVTNNDNNDNKIMANKVTIYKCVFVHIYAGQTDCGKSIYV